MAFGYAVWMVPNRIINGGVTSLSQILNHYISVDIPTVNSLLLGFLLILTLIFLGREVFIKSIISSFIYSISFTVIFRLDLKMTVTPVVDLLMASVMIAFGYYACLSSHASTVGVDVLVLIIKKYKPSINLSMAIRWFNYTILAFGFFAFGLWSVVYGVAFSFIYSHELNWMLNTGKYAKVKKK